MLFRRKTKKNNSFSLVKSDDDRRFVFGWASVAVRADGEVIVDSQNDVIDISELENAAYEYTVNFGAAGENHEKAAWEYFMKAWRLQKRKPRNGYP